MSAPSPASGQNGEGGAAEKRGEASGKEGGQGAPTETSATTTDELATKSPASRNRRRRDDNRQRNERKNGAEKDREQQEDEGSGDENSLCLVCSNRIKWYGVWEGCGHSVCWKCALRIRYMNPDDPKSVLCCICQKPSPGIAVQAGPEPKDTEAFEKDTTGWSVSYETPAIRDAVDHLRGLYCHYWKTCEHKKPFASLKKLQDHLWYDHGGVSMCEVCVKGNMSFVSEQTLYSDEQMKIHERDDRQCKKDSTSFVGHPLCHFCRTRQYDNDALYLHLREKHCLCDLCEMSDEGEKLVFYRNSDAMVDHFCSTHLTCKTCERTYFELRKRKLPQPFHPTEWTFGNELDLQVHMQSEHGSKVAGSVVKDMLYSNTTTSAGRQRGNGGANASSSAAGQNGEASQHTIITFDLGRNGRRTMRFGALPVARDNRARKADKSYESMEGALRAAGASDTAIESAKEYLAGSLRAVEFYAILRSCIEDLDSHITSITASIPSPERREGLKLAHNMAMDSETGTKGAAYTRFTLAVSTSNNLTVHDFPALGAAADASPANGSSTPPPTPEAAPVSVSPKPGQKPGGKKSVWSGAAQRLARPEAQSSVKTMCRAPDLKSAEDFPSLPGSQPVKAWAPKPVISSSSSAPRTVTPPPEPKAAEPKKPPNLTSADDFPALGGAPSAVRAKPKGAWGR